MKKIHYYSELFTSLLRKHGVYKAAWNRAQIIEGWTVRILMQEMSGARPGHTMRMPTRKSAGFVLPPVYEDLEARFALEIVTVQGIRRSPWCESVELKAPPPPSPGKPCARLVEMKLGFPPHRKDLCLTWMPPPTHDVYSTEQWSRIKLQYTIFIDADHAVASAPPSNASPPTRLRSSIFTLILTLSGAPHGVAMQQADLHA